MSPENQAQFIASRIKLRFGLDVDVKVGNKENRVFSMLAPMPDPQGNPQPVALFFLYWLPKDQRYYLQDKRYATYHPLKAVVLEILKSVPI